MPESFCVFLPNQKPERRGPFGTGLVRHCPQGLPASRRSLLFLFFLAWHVIESLLHKEESSLIFSAKKLICIGETSVPQTACLLSEVNKYTAELSLGSSRNTLSRRTQISTEICIKLFTRRRIKRRDRRRSFSISLNFYQTILELSPQTRVIDALTFTPGETQDDPRRLRIAIDLPEFRRIPKAGHITDYSKAESTGVRYEVQRCVTPQLNLLLFRFVTFH